MASKRSLEDRKTIASARVEAEQTQAECQKALTRAGGLAAERDAIPASAAWRVTAPFGEMAARLFPRTRQRLKRLAASPLRLWRRAALGRRRARKQQLAAIRDSPLFDRDWYLSQYPDVAAAAFDPVEHYVDFGSAEGRDPGPGFDTQAYRAWNPDVAESGVNPLAHFVMFGAAEGRTWASYEHWVRDYDTLDDGDRAAIGVHIKEMKRRPLISVVMPVFNTTDRYLREAIESVLDQLYPHWELCIADDASTMPNVGQALRDYERRDPRIKVAYRAENGHISAASNSALELVGGEFVALLDHDDLLAPHALYMIADAINKCPDADLFYSDEDKINDAGRRSQPYFKTDWNQELLYSQNFVSHLGVYRTSLVRQLGGFRIGLDGSQDYDLALRVTAHTRGPVVHIPHILYHWRLFPSAATFSSLQPDKAATAARRAITEQLASLGETAVVIQSVRGYHRAIRQEPDRWPPVSVIVPTRDHADVLVSCIEGLLEKTDYPNLEIIIADNDSHESETKAVLSNAARHGVKILPSPGPFNFSRINNAAAREATGDILLFLNNDISMIDRSWLKEMIIYAMRSDVGAVGARLLYPDGTVQHAGVILGLGGIAGHIHRGASSSDLGYFARLKVAQDISCVTAACMAIRKAVFEEIGGFDEKNLPIAFNDVDLCIRLRIAGYRIIYTPHAELYHLESKSRGSDLVASQLERFRQETGYMARRWREQLASDPFFNPNLSLENSSPAPAFPPRVGKVWHAYKERALAAMDGAAAPSGNDAC